MAANPFVYGEIVPPASFVGREVELDRLTTDLADGQKVFLISPRRYGKSSLIRQTLAALDRRRMATLEVTVSSFSSYVAFLEGYTKALASLETRPAGLRWWLKDQKFSFPAVRTERDAARLAEEVFALPGKIASRTGRRIAIALDEFQAIASFNGGSPLNIEEALRAAVQRQRQVGYVFAGSEPSLMEQMIGRSRPFYKAGPVMRLGKIPADVFGGFVEHRFKKSGIAPEPGLGAAIVDLSGNLPYDVQRLAHETWDDMARDRRRRAGLADLHTTLHRLLSEQDTFLEAIWQRLTLAQRAVLRAVVIEHGVEILAADIRARHRLGGASSVQAALAALQRQDVISRDEGSPARRSAAGAKAARYVVIDSLMREWVARKTF